MKNDPAVSPDDLKKAAWELYQNQVKQTAKYTMISELPRFGIGMLGRSGWEADNWAYLLSCELYGKQISLVFLLLKTQIGCIVYHQLLNYFVSQEKMKNLG